MTKMLNNPVWYQIRWQVSVREYVYIMTPDGRPPAKGLGRCTVPLQAFGWALTNNLRVEYLSVDGKVLEIDLLKTDADFDAWFAKRNKYILDCEVSKLYRT